MEKHFKLTETLLIRHLQTCQGVATDSECARATEEDTCKHKLTCTNCNKFYIGRSNRNFNTRFKEHRKDFRYAEGKSKFSEYILNGGHEMKIKHLENNHRKINILEEIEILNAASSKHLLNDVIAGQNDPIYKLLPTSVI